MFMQTITLNYQVCESSLEIFRPLLQLSIIFGTLQWRVTLGVYILNILSALDIFEDWVETVFTVMC